MLALRGTVADFTLASDPQRVFQGVMGLTFVQSNLGPALHIGIEQPFNDEQSPFDPSDFTQSDGKVMLTWMRRKLFQELAGKHDARHHCGNAAQDIWPVSRNRAFPDFATDQPLRDAAGGQRHTVVLTADPECEG